MVADLYKPANQQYAVSFIVLASVLGAVIGGMAGAIMQQYTNWRWNASTLPLFYHTPAKESTSLQVS